MKKFDKSTLPEGSRILYLTMQRQWFKMVLSGEKTEEYRDISMHWAQRFEFIIKGIKQPYTHILFRNGYLPNSPWVLRTFDGVAVGYPREEWAPVEMLVKSHYIITHLNEIDRYDRI